LADRLARDATYFGRHPDIAIRDDGRIVLSLNGPNHAGVTVADLKLADMVELAVEQHERDGDVWDARG
jgi:pterin-4a-carbinolamine dehydratase